MKEAASCFTYIELPHLVFDVALREVLHVGELEVHLRQPHQDPLTSPLKVFSLRGKVLRANRAQDGGLLFKEASFQRV